MSTAFPSPRLVIYSKRDKVRLARLVLENSASLICGLKPNRLGATLCPARRRRRRVVWVFCGWDGLSSNSPDAPSPPPQSSFVLCCQRTYPGKLQCSIGQAGEKTHDAGLGCRTGPEGFFAATPFLFQGVSAAVWWLPGASLRDFLLAALGSFEDPDCCCIILASCCGGLHPRGCIG